jgi:hypothetical protein
VIASTIRNNIKYDFATRIVYQHAYLPNSIFIKGPDHCAGEGDERGGMGKGEGGRGM